MSNDTPTAQSGPITDDVIARHVRRCAQQCRDEGHFDVACGFDEVAKMIASKVATPPAGARDAVTDGTLNKAMDAFNHVTMLGAPTRLRLRAALEAALTGKANGETT